MALDTLIPLLEKIRETAEPVAPEACRFGWTFGVRRLGALRKGLGAAEIDDSLASWLAWRACETSPEQAIADLERLQSTPKMVVLGNLVVPANASLGRGIQIAPWAEVAPDAPVTGAPTCALLGSSKVEASDFDDAVLCIGIESTSAPTRLSGSGRDDLEESGRRARPAVELSAEQIQSCADRMQLLARHEPELRNWLRISMGRFRRAMQARRVVDRLIDLSVALEVSVMLGERRENRHFPRDPKKRPRGQTAWINEGAKELLEVRAEEGKQVGVLLGMLAQLRGDAAHSGEIGDGADAALLDKVAELVANVIDGRLRRGREPRPSRLSLP